MESAINHSAFFEATAGQWEYLLRLLLGIICGAAIGIERSHRQKEAGIRTHIIVTVGAVLMMLVSKYGFFDVVKFDSINVDASRIAANIITGISFLGAGVIFLKGGAIKGLTTSAGLWTSSGIGLAIGAGMYTVGIFSTVLVLCVQYLLHRFNFSSENISSNEITVVCNNDEETVGMIKNLFISRDILVQEFSVKKNTDNTVTMLLTVKMSENTALDELMVLATGMEEIKELTVTT